MYDGLTLEIVRLDIDRFIILFSLFSFLFYFLFEDPHSASTPIVSKVSSLERLNEILKTYNEQSLKHALVRYK